MFFKETWNIIKEKYLSDFLAACMYGLEGSRNSTLFYDKIKIPLNERVKP